MLHSISNTILILSKYSKNIASARARIYSYKEFLRSDGYRLVIIPIENNFTESSKYVDKTKRILLPIIAAVMVPFFDIFIVHRFIPNNLTLMKLFIKLSRKFIFDYDESLHVDVWGKALTDDALSYLNKMISSCDITIVSNSYLRDYSSAFNKNVEILPTAIDVKKYPVKEHSQDYPIVIGWIGSGGAQQYLELLTDVFSKLYNKYKSKVYLEVVTSPAYRIKLETSLLVKHIDWRLKYQYQYFLNFDIGIMPIPDNARSRGKASYKALEYMASGIPVVASPVGMNNEVILNGDNGFLPKSNNDWYEVLCLLIEDHALREQIGTRGRGIVVERFSLEKCYETFKTVIEKEHLVSKKGRVAQQRNREL